LTGQPWNVPHVVKNFKCPELLIFIIPYGSKKGAKAMSEPYTLPFRLSEAELKDLNAGQSDKDDKLYSPEFRFALFMKNREGVMSLDWIHKVIKACRSGKKIVNPLSPEEIFKMNYRSALDEARIYVPEEGYSKRDSDYVEGARMAINCAAELHPDLKDWLKDGDEHG
jgi:hypothetical protein